MICTADGCTAHFACQLRAKSVSVAPSATPNRTAVRKPVFRRPEPPSWERGRMGETRPGGSRMPYLGADGKPIPVKAWAENRSGYEQRVKRLKSDPNVFAAERAAPPKASNP